MARLQDFSDVTPSSSSDKLLIVQSAGQGLATLDTAGQQIANNTSVSQLNTTRKTLAGAINEHDSEIGSLSSLTTSDKSSLVGAVNEVNKITVGTFTAGANITLLRSTLIKANSIKFLSIIFAVTGSSNEIGTMSSGFGATYNYDFTIANDKGTATRARINQNNSLSFSTTPVQGSYYALTIAYI